ncbi:MAG: Fic family protein [Planctomycetes bacterium]|nr:Fic family protein [Planctomycetota bacterium]
MFKPNFRYTNKMVRLLTRISSAKEVILNSPLIPMWEISLRKQSIICSAHSSTSIEGNKLSLEQVSDLAQGRKIMATRKDKQEVLNYLNALENIADLSKGNSFNPDDILYIHRLVTRGTLDNPADCGAYRTRYVVVANRLTGEITFRPPENKEVPGLTKILINWLNSSEAQELDPIMEAGIAHYEFVRIHPFIDGNGRTARVLAALILYKRGFDSKQFFCLDDYYDSDRPAYYAALRKVNQNTGDLTEWLEYFIEGVMASIESVKQRILKLSGERLRKSKQGQIALTERQMRIVEFINQNNRITNRDVRTMFKISDRAALKEIRKLVDLTVIKPEGKGRSLCYVLA